MGIHLQTLRSILSSWRSGTIVRPESRASVIENIDRQHDPTRKSLRAKPYHVMIGYLVDDQSHTLAFLLEFNGRVHWYEQGYSTRFIIRRIKPTDLHPHRLQYSFTLHAPAGTRIMGFDNAHVVTPPGRNAKRPAGRPLASDRG